MYTRGEKQRENLNFKKPVMHVMKTKRSLIRWLFHGLWTPYGVLWWYHRHLFWLFNVSNCETRMSLISTSLCCCYSITFIQHSVSILKSANVSISFLLFNNHQWRDWIQLDYWYLLTQLVEIRVFTHFQNTYLINWRLITFWKPNEHECSDILNNHQHNREIIS